MNTEATNGHVGWMRRWKVFGMTFAVAKGCSVRPKWSRGCNRSRSMNGQRKTNLMANAHKKKGRIYEAQGRCCWAKKKKTKRRQQKQARRRNK